MRLKLAAVGSAVSVALTVLYFVNPQKPLLLPCPFKTITGLNCPACGSTRAVHHLLHGRLLLALRCNALFVLGLPYILNFLNRYVRNAIEAGRLHIDVKLTPSESRRLIVFAILFGLLRNIPYKPFNQFIH